MLFTLYCPKCGAEQKYLDLTETNGSYICSKCGAEVNENLEELKKQANKDETKSLKMDNMIDVRSMQYYNDNYYPLFGLIQKTTKGGYEIVDFLNGTIKSNTLCIRDKINRCRFCGKTTPEVTFKEKAHLFPESLGNKLFVSKNECDSCNHVFAKYELDLNTFLFPLLVLNGVRGKNGIKKYRSNDKSSRVEHTENGFKITENLGKFNIHDDEVKKELQYEFDINPYSLSNVYRILLKMALSILPEDEFAKFSFAKDALINRRLIGCEAVMLDFFPGFNRFEFTVVGYMNKVNNPAIPSYQFAIMNGDFLLQIPIFSDDYIKNNDGKEITLDLRSVPTPFDVNSYLGNKKHFVYQVKDDSVTPQSKMAFTLKYESKTEVK